MTIKRLFGTALIVISVAGALSADWQDDVRRCLNTPRDFSGASAYLRENLDRIDPLEKQNALGLLAFLAAQVGADDEAERIVEYFETYGDSLPTFFFPDEGLGRDFFAYWAKWESFYPLITETVLLDRIADHDQAPPGWLEIGVNVLNDAYYKISLSDRPLEGGFWQKGFHIVRLPFAEMYGAAGNTPFEVTLKAGHLLLKKRIMIRVDVQTSGETIPLPPVSSETKARDIPKPNPSPFAGEVSLYVGDELVLTSKKLSVQQPPLKIKIPGPSAPGTKPYLAPQKNNFAANSVSVLDAVRLAYNLIKDLSKKKDSPSLSKASYSKTRQLAFSFAHSGPSGEKAISKTTVSLDPAKAELFRKEKQLF